MEDCAADVPDKTFLQYKTESFTYRQMNANANRVAAFLVADAELLDTLTPVMDTLERIRPDTVFINAVEEEARGIALPGTMGLLSRAYRMPAVRPDIQYDPEDLCLIIYTSGITGPPKGVVYRYNTTGDILRKWVCTLLNQPHGVACGYGGAKTPCCRHRLS